MIKEWRLKEVVPDYGSNKGKTFYRVVTHDKTPITLDFPDKEIPMLVAKAPSLLNSLEELSIRYKDSLVHAGISSGLIKNDPWLSRAEYLVNLVRGEEKR